MTIFEKEIRKVIDINEMQFVFMLERGTIDATYYKSVTGEIPWKKYLTSPM